MKRRPTIPFFKWHFAVHLEHTQSVQNHPDMPATNCNCELCVNWKTSYENIIPSQTLSELRRLGVQLDKPNELYGHPPNLGKRHVRAVYHIVGRILSGPESVTFHQHLEEHIDNYEPIRNEPWFSVRVVKASESYAPSPSIQNAKVSDVIVLDFRFEM